MEAIFTIGIFMSFFIAFLLLTKKNKALSDRLLAIWVTVIGIHLLNYYLNQLGYWEKYPHLVGIAAPFPLLHGPLLYLYTLYSLRTDASLRRIDYLHFAPVVIVYLYMSNFFFFYTAEEKAMVDSGESTEFAVFTTIMLIGFIISGITYPILAYRLTWKHQQKIDNNFSYEEGITLNWLRNCIYAIGIVYLIAAVVIVLRNGMNMTFSFNVDYIFYSILILFIFYLGYFGIRHQDMFTNNMSTKITNPAKIPSDEKYRKSGLKDQALNDLHKRLRTFMETEKPYLDPKVNLPGMAGQLGVSSNQLSQVINQKEQVNFHDFINQYRTEEFIRRASENPGFSLLAHALDSGFNSKSSFNSVFKKQKGQTPSQFLTNRD
jgi:AraC-like DNA-binding protein